MPHEPLCEQAAAKFPFREERHEVPFQSSSPREREAGLQVLLRDLVEDGLFRMATAIRNDSTSL